jgi:hypothetical protein
MPLLINAISNVDAILVSKYLHSGLWRDDPPLGGPVEKMSFFQIVHTTKVSTQIHSSKSQYDVYKVS